MKEVILSFNELTDMQKELAVENYKSERLRMEEDEEYLKEYADYTDTDWYECAKGYSYNVTYFDDGNCSVNCLF